MAKATPRRAASPSSGLDKYGPVSTLVVGALLALVGAWTFMVGPSNAWASAQSWPGSVASWAGSAAGAVQGSRCSLGTCTAKEQASDALAGLRIEVESHANTYRRARFGDPWYDVNGNHCDTRDDILRRDLQGAVTRPTKTCSIGAPVSGTFVEPYLGATVTFNKAEAIKVQIDHVVSLGEAWRSGAYAWDDTHRRAYANDPDVLVTTTQQINDAKSDYDIQLPWRQCVTRGPAGRCTGWRDDRPGGARACTYATKVIAIKKKYDLTVDPEEFTTLGRVLAKCS